MILSRCKEIYFKIILIVKLNIKVAKFYPKESKPVRLVLFFL